MRLIQIQSILFLCVSATAGFAAEPIQVLSWNVESNRPGQPPVSDATTIALELVNLMTADSTAAGIVALCEVDPTSFNIYQQAVATGLKKPVDFVTNASGGFQDSDCLMLVVDRLRYEIREAIEVHRYAGIAANYNSIDPGAADSGALRARSPLIVKLKDRTNNAEFWILVNHLARGESDLRVEQARMLSAWAKDHEQPIVAVGDYNFDYEFATQKGNDGFDAMMKSGVWKWLKPDPLIDSNWARDYRIKDANVDRYPDSILDFVFVANQAKDWNGKSIVVVRPGDFPDDEKTSDHRPTFTTLMP